MPTAKCIDDSVLEAAELHVREYLNTRLDKRFGYHDLSHTLRVVQAAAELSRASGLKKHEQRLVRVAAWFHDLGYVECQEGHEEAGARMAAAFLAERQIMDQDIETVKGCILATHYPQKPQTLLQQILCDADMIHLSDKAFLQRSGQLRLEWEETRQLAFSDGDWYALNLEFLANHRYHTNFCRDCYEEKKQRNIERLQKEIRRMKKGAENMPPDRKNLKKQVKWGKEKEKERFGRGVETLFRSAYSNHMRLSGMADNKAHILLSINSIIVSIVLSVLVKKLIDMPFLVIPTIMLLMVSVGSMVFAVLTTTPKLTRGLSTPEQIARQEANLLFFGNFHKMDLSTYQWGIREMMQDPEYLYRSMTMDIYYMGKVLAIKYRYLGIGYRLFMYGMIVAILAYGISFLLGFQH